MLKNNFLKDDIIIRKGILHILDSEKGCLGLATNMMDMGPDLYDMIRDQLYKILDNDEKIKCKLQENTTIGKTIMAFDEADDEKFIQATRTMADQLFDIMCDSVQIPSADLLCVSFQLSSNIYLALLKMNYKPTYRHHQNKDDVTDIVKQNVIQSGKPTEAIIFDLAERKDVYLVQKKYEMLNGDKCNYLSERFLQCYADISPKRKFQILNKTIMGIINRIEIQNGLEKQLDKKKAFYDQFMDDGMFNVNKIGDELFGNQADSIAAYNEKMEHYDMQYGEFEVVKDSTVNSLNYQQIETDTGVVIKIPMEIFEESGIEVKENKMDGTTSLTVTFETAKLK